MSENDAESVASAEEESPPNADEGDGTKKRGRRTSLFPATTFEDALELASAIYKMGSGKPVRRITLLDELGKSPSSSTTRQQITNSSRYGLTSGGYNADELKLTPSGLRVVSDSTKAADRTKATFELAIEHVPVFKSLYETYLDNRLPVQAVLVDKALELEIPADDAASCVETFTVNAKYVGVLRSISGAERFISLDTLVADYLPQTSGPTPETRSTSGTFEVTESEVGDDYANTCFYVTPIGDDDSEHRKHADLFMGALVEPALAEFKLKVVRADQIGEAGMITRQIIDYIMHSRLVVADLSYHNPNVFYELALRHAVRKPIVQITRLADKIPFDLGQQRTVVVDTTDIYSLVPQLATFQAQIGAQIRKTLQEGQDVENPLSVFAPKFWNNLPTPSAS